MKILIVDDSDAMRRIIKRVLKSFPWKLEVVEARDGRQAIEVFGKERPQLVITDWNMPEMDGTMLCRHLRAKSFQKYVYVIMMTANTDSNERIEGLESGADDFISKPIVPRELLARLQSGERIHRLEARLRFEMSHDPLTGIMNRRAFEDVFHREVTRSRRYKCRLSCVMFGLDEFKSINDTYGHLAGDFTLKMVAARFKQGLRATDYFCRYVEDQFILLLPETDLAGAEILAHRLAEKLESQKIEFDGHPIGVTAGFGVAELDRDDREDDQLINYAETALHKAKENGPNEIVIMSGNFQQA